MRSQWGSWVSAEATQSGSVVKNGRDWVDLARSQRYCWPDGREQFFARQVRIGADFCVEESEFAVESGVLMVGAAKERTGNVLDGMRWEQFPWGLAGELWGIWGVSGGILGGPWGYLGGIGGNQRRRMYYTLDIVWD